MKIRITDSTIIAGAHAPVGSIHEVPEGEGLQIIGAGRAVRHVEPAKAEAAQAAPAVEQAAAAPVVEKKARAKKA